MIYPKSTSNPLYIKIAVKNTNLNLTLALIDHFLDYQGLFSTDKELLKIYSRITLNAFSSRIIDS